MVGTRNTMKNTRKEPAIRHTLNMRERHANAERHAGVQVHNPPPVSQEPNDPLVASDNVDHPNDPPLLPPLPNR